MLLGGYFRPLAAALLVGGILAYGVSGRSCGFHGGLWRRGAFSFCVPAGPFLLMPAGNLEGVAQFRKRVAMTFMYCATARTCCPRAICGRQIS